jgi:hypothetical protein
MLRNLPVLAKGIDRSPTWREELRIKWYLSDFSSGDASRPTGKLVTTQEGKP